VIAVEELEKHTKILLGNLKIINMGNPQKLGNFVNALFQDSSNNVGIGAAPSGSYKLEVTGTGRFTSIIYGSNGNLDPTAGTNAGTTLALNGNSVANNYSIGLGAIRNSAYDMWFQTGATNGGGYRWYIGTSEKMTMSNTGNVAIGTSTFPSAIGVNDLLVLGKSGSASNAINFSNGSTTNWAYILAESAKMVLGTGSSSSIAFETNAGSERMRITSGGGVYIGLTSSGTNVFAVSYDGIRSSLYVTNSGSVGAYTFGTGPVYANAGLLTMTNPSDSRLKENIEDINWGLSDILKLRPVSYHWKDDKINQGVQFGFIAQEVQDVMPEAIKEFGEDVKYLGLEKDAIYATLVKAIQELNERLNKAGL
jgi:hypothetical protein